MTWMIKSCLLNVFCSIDEFHVKIGYFSAIMMQSLKYSDHSEVTDTVFTAIFSFQILWPLWSQHFYYSFVTIIPWHSCLITTCPNHIWHFSDKKTNSKAHEMSWPTLHGKNVLSFTHKLQMQSICWSRCITILTIIVYKWKMFSHNETTFLLFFDNTQLVTRIVVN